MTEAQLSDFLTFLPLVRVDFNKREVYGRMTQEIPDGHKEIMDYATSKPYFQSWSAAAQARTALLPDADQSRGNLRAMHIPIAAGKLIAIDYKDAEKAIDIGVHVVDDDSWNKVLKGVYTGFSIGGNYVTTWLDPKNPQLKRYTARPVEVSLVDSPAVPTATFTMIKADGSSELHKLGEPLDIPPIPDNVHETIENPPTPAVVIIESSDAPIKEVPMVADHFASPNLIENEAVPVTTPQNNPAAPDAAPDLEVLKAFTVAVNELVALKAAAAEEKTQQETLLKALGLRVGIARRESEPLVPRSDTPATADDYGDPANWSWPCDTPARCETAIAGFNKGQSREKYTDREWHVLGRRIAAQASEQFGTRYPYDPQDKKITSPEKVNKMEMNKDVAGLIAQLRAGIDVAADQIGKDPAAAKDMLMSLLGNLDDSNNATPANTSTAKPAPNGGGQGDGVGKAADTVTKDDLPPVAAADKPKDAPTTSSPESSSVSKALEAKVDDLASKFEQLMAKLNTPAPVTPAAEPAPVVAKNNPAGDLAALMPAPAPAIPPVIAALMSGDKNALQKAAVLAGSAERPDFEAVMKMAQEYAAASIKPNFTQMLIAPALANVPSFAAPAAN